MQTTNVCFLPSNFPKRPFCYRPACAKAAHSASRLYQLRKVDVLATAFMAIHEPLAVFPRRAISRVSARSRSAMSARILSSSLVE
jgi:hypothetical protein